MTTNNIKTSSYASYMSFTTICAVFFTIAFVSISQNIFIDTNTAWLLQCLQRFTEGGTYTKNFFETAPPLNFLIYFPVLAFLKSDAATIKMSLIFLFLVYALISNIVSYLLLKKSDTPTHVITTLLLAILFAQTWGMGFFSITNDALIFTCLIPLCIAQYSITINIKQSKPLLIIACLIGTLGICIKPIYLIIPLAFFIHRTLSTKKVCNTILSIDFIYIFILVLSYIAIILLVFPDYLYTILPHAINLDYTPPTVLLLKNMATFTIFSLFTLLLVGFIPKEVSYKKEYSFIANTSIYISILCFFAFIAQGKGHLFNAIPFFGFTAIGLFISISTLLTNFIARKYSCIWITTILLSILCLPLLTGFTNAPHLTHKKFKNIEFFKKINQLAPNHTYINYDFKPNYLALPFYYNLKNVSRFGILWTLDGLNLAFERAQNDKEKEIIKSKFTYFIELLAEDIQNNKPDVICIPRYPPVDSDIPEQRLLPFLLKNESYAKAFENYTFKENFVYEPKSNVKSKNPDTSSNITFDLYIRTESKDENTPQKASPPSEANSSQQQ